MYSRLAHSSERENKIPRGYEDIDSVSSMNSNGFGENYAGRKIHCWELEI